jgi:DNA-binding PadR family transcriptional regulator
MSATRLLILGVVRMSQPVHGYDVRRELLSWSADKWGNVQPGSIYHALRKLAEEGMLTAVEKESVANRPARTLYEITDKGETEFQHLLRDSWWNIQTVADPFMAAFSLLPALPREEAVEALRNRARVLQAGVESLRASMGSAWIRDLKPTNVAWMFELWVVRGEAEISWCERIAGLIESGMSYWPDSLRGSPEFRAMLDRDPGSGGAAPPAPDA